MPDEESPRRVCMLLADERVESFVVERAAGLLSWWQTVRFNVPQDHWVCCLSRQARRCYRCSYRARRYSRKPSCVARSAQKGCQHPGGMCGQFTLFWVCRGYQSVCCARHRVYRSQWREGDLSVPVGDASASTAITRQSAGPREDFEQALMPIDNAGAGENGFRLEVPVRDLHCWIENLRV